MFDVSEIQPMSSEYFALVILAEKILPNTGIRNDTGQRTPEQRFTYGSECRGVFVFRISIR